ncbi:MAG: hypothetical protein JSS49_25265 [Planctomycetes bacterium]|nr:hypothetical protein [Planctomycetota bacterium]
MDGDAIRADADAIYRERVLRARNTPPDQKMIEGVRLFERACGLMRDGIRHQFPHATAQEVDAMVQERLEIAQRLEDGNLYQPCPENEL